MSEGLIETGSFSVGKNRLKNETGNKYHITNSKGIRHYDSITGDNPTQQEEKNICSEASLDVLNNIKESSNKELEDNFIATLTSSYSFSILHGGYCLVYLLQHLKKTKNKLKYS